MNSESYVDRDLLPVQFFCCELLHCELIDEQRVLEIFLGDSLPPVTVILE